MNEWAQGNEAVAFIQSRIPARPAIGIILGTGLSPLGEKIRDATVIPFSDIPHFPVPTVETHVGNLVVGKLGASEVVAMQGRFHMYEGYTAAEVVFPIRVMKMLGVSTLLESNAAGGLDPFFRRGDLAIIADHINLMNDNPLVGKNDDRFGIRFPDMSEPYDTELITLAEDVAREEKIPVRKGVLVGLTGPCLETKAEYRFLRAIGADMVTMSTVPEVIAAVHMKMRVFGVSIITDMCLPDALKPAAIEEIITAAESAEPMLTRLVERLIMNIQVTREDT